MGWGGASTWTWSYSWTWCYGHGLGWGEVRLCIDVRFKLHMHFWKEHTQKICLKSMHKHVTCQDQIQQKGVRVSERSFAICIHIQMLSLNAKSGVAICKCSGRRRMIEGSLEKTSSTTTTILLQLLRRRRPRLLRLLRRPMTTTTTTTTTATTTTTSTTTLQLHYITLQYTN